jgi:hypothetical protein
LLIAVVVVAADVADDPAPNENWLLIHALLRRKQGPAPLALVVGAGAEYILLKEFITVIILYDQL